MKFDNYIVTYLNQQKVLSLKGIGEFTIDSSFKLQEEISDNYFFPEGAIRFTYNKRAETSPEFLEYLKQFFTKPITLITSDVEDYLLEIENFLNIGRSFTIIGLGTLEKRQDGVIEYFSGKSKIENIAAIVDALSKRETQFDSLFNKLPKNSNQKIIKAVAIFIVFLLIIIGTWLIIRFTKDKSSQNEVQENEVSLISTTDSTIEQSTKPIITSNTANDTLRYKMYFLASKYKYVADSIYKKWSKITKVNRDSILVDNILRHRLFIYRKSTIKDTTTVKAELEKYFNHAITIELAQ
ncbi:MAG: hypothetical protein LC122_00975 [Chitinophagales bacterium]|nr:hypothetical protein [Chitinophagales bacterium]